MKNYQVGVWETVGGYIDIEANSEKEAEAKVMKLVADSGIDNTGHDLKVTHREYDVCDCIKIK